MVGEIRGVRYSKCLAYIHSGSVRIKRNGKYHTRQIYLCKDCGKRFNAALFSGTHYPYKWQNTYKHHNINEGNFLRNKATLFTKRDFF